MLLSIDFNFIVNKFKNLRLAAEGKRKVDRQISSHPDAVSLALTEEKIPKPQELWTLT